MKTLVEKLIKIPVTTFEVLRREHATAIEKTWFIPREISNFSESREKDEMVSCLHFAISN